MVERPPPAALEGVATPPVSPTDRSESRVGQHPDILTRIGRFGISKGAIYYWIRADDAKIPDYQGFRRRFYLARAAGYARKWGGPPDPPPEPRARNGGG